MAAVRCLICKSPPLRLFVDTLLDKGISNAGIAAAMIDAGGKLDPDVIGRHKNNGHWVKPQRTEGPKPTKGDLAVLVRDKAYEAIVDKDPDMLLLMGREVAPLIGKGLAAQAQLDKREVNERKHGLAAGALALQAFLAGLGHGTPPPELEDGNTTDGTFEEVTGDRPQPTE